MMFILRILGSFAVAAVVVFTMLALGSSFWSSSDGEGRRDATLVELMSTIDLAKIFGGEYSRPRRPELPKLEDIPPLEIASHEVSGFVQLEVDVSADGAVEDVRVIGAVPSGYYEDEALEIIRRKRYRPSFEDGARTETEVIEFTVNPAESP